MVTQSYIMFGFCFWILIRRFLRGEGFTAKAGGLGGMVECQVGVVSLEMPSYVKLNQTS